MGKIIGMTGLAGAGKNTVAEMVSQIVPNCTLLSFGSAVKDICSVMFNWPRALMEGDTIESREWREKTDDFWSKKLNQPNFTPRKAMQWFATDVVRNQLSQNFWVDKVENKMLKDLNSFSYILITDVRFKNEIDMIKNLKGEIWQISRDPMPTWFSIAEQYNINKKTNSNIIMPELLRNVHQSETEWIGYTKPDVKIHSEVNSLELLKNKVFQVCKQRGMIK